MPTTPWRTAGTVAATNWTANTNFVADLATSDNNRMRRTPAVNNPETIIQTNFGFGNDIPPGAKIIAIEREFEARHEDGFDTYTLSESVTANASTILSGTSAQTGANAIGNPGATDVLNTFGNTTNFLYGAAAGVITASIVRSTNFGFLDTLSADIGPHVVGVDFGRARITWLPGSSGEDVDEEESSMDLYRAGQSGGVTALLTEALPACSSSTAIFNNAPANTMYVEFCFQTQNVWIKWEGGTATASAGGGIKYSTDVVYRRPLTAAVKATVKAIQEGATATGTITYFGKA